ncbi:hypothetical protein NLG97_g7863 [Lecanicillium saksenae]|uniref:Uncharacterized protein n=1 Tax=Lecanicillium saksenae TaxID=468837 RepID=A0ACC1QL48_9HYPO|nr:hypothetical protein NLG97_g7863 [Lecanicillium saksenae]
MASDTDMEDKVSQYREDLTAHEMKIYATGFANLPLTDYVGRSTFLTERKMISIPGMQECFYQLAYGTLTTGTVTQTRFDAASSDRGIDGDLESFRVIKMFKVIFVGQMNCLAAAARPRGVRIIEEAAGVFNIKFQLPQFDGSQLTCLQFLPRDKRFINHQAYGIPLEIWRTMPLVMQRAIELGRIHRINEALLVFSFDEGKNLFDRISAETQEPFLSIIKDFFLPIHKKQPTTPKKSFPSLLFATQHPVSSDSSSFHTRESGTMGQPRRANMLSSPLALKFANHHGDPERALALLGSHPQLQSQHTRDLLEQDTVRLLSPQFPDGRSRGHAMRLVSATALLEMCAAFAPHMPTDLEARHSLVRSFAAHRPYVVAKFRAPRAGIDARGPAVAEVVARAETSSSARDGRRDKKEARRASRDINQKGTNEYRMRGVHLEDLSQVLAELEVQEGETGMDQCGKLGGPHDLEESVMAVAHGIQRLWVEETWW